MRRAILAAALSGVLLTGAACDSQAKTGNSAAPSLVTPSSEPASATPDYSADTKVVCAKLKKVFSDDVRTFGTQVGTMIANKEAKKGPAAAIAQKAASEQLEKMGLKVKEATAVAQDPELQTAGATSAGKFAKSAADTAFFDGINTAKDLDRTIQTQMAEWLTPVAGYCG